MKKLQEYGVRAFATAREVESNPADRSTMVAYTVGAQAYRLGMTEEEMSRWFQGAYSSLWVRESNLNPGLDAKDVRERLLQAYRKTKKRDEGPSL